MLYGCDPQFVHAILVLFVKFTLIVLGTSVVSSETNSYFNSSPQTSSRSKITEKSAPILISATQQRKPKFGMRVLSEYALSSTASVGEKVEIFETNHFMANFLQENRTLRSSHNFNDNVINNANGKHSLQRLKRELIREQAPDDDDHDNNEGHVQKRYHETLIHCLPVYHIAEKGHFHISQSNTFQVECQRGMTRPLNTFGNWSCDPLMLLNESEAIPTMCFAKVLPTLITMEREVVINGLGDSECGHTDRHLEDIQDMWKKKLIEHKKTTFIQDGLKFTFSMKISGGVCVGKFRNFQNFRVQTKVRMKVTHQPISFRLKRSTRPKVQEVLDLETKFTLNAMRDSNKISNYSLIGNFLYFQAGDCLEGLVQKNEKIFTTEIPSCRSCDRGMFLEKETGVCYRCPRGSYTLEEQTCMPCPLMVKSRSVSAYSLADCFSAFLCSDCIFQELKESFAIFAGYHVCITVWILWSLRDALRSVAKDEDLDDKASTIVKP